ncbi:MAG TPA: hypothetical protein VFO45_09010 [Sphingomicrobium sp.]|nr:hypothetical protein [Sphingomicrobium sp.]
MRRDLQSRGERARAAAAAIAVNLFLGIAFVTGLALREDKRLADSLQTFDVSLPPPPPPPAVTEPEDEQAKSEPEGAAGREASPVAAPPTPIARPTPVVAAPVPASATASTSGNADRGSGPGAGGAGSGSGGGGSGGGGGIGSEARLLGGWRGRIPRQVLRGIPQDRGYAHLLLTISANGRAVGCEVMTSSGYAMIDQSLCGVMVGSSRWEAARDRGGRPITVKVRYTATWSKD